MSKYRIAAKPSHQYRQRAVLAAHGLGVLSIWLWQPCVHSYQYVLQWLLSLMCGLSLLWWLNRPSQAKEFSVSEQGEWLWTQPGLPERLLARQSRVTGWVLLIRLQDKLTGKAAERLMIFRDELSEQDYRRLCRIIIRRQSQYNQQE